MSQDKKKLPEVELNATDLLNDPAMTVEPEQVKDVRVIYVPFKDFEARVNQDNFLFRAGVPTEISRDLAADLLRDPKRGYIRD